MSPMTMDHDHHQSQESGYSDGSHQWPDNGSNYSHSQHTSPVHEYTGYAFNPLPMEPMYPTTMHPPRTTHQQLQPLIMPTWPSMLTSQSAYVPPIFPSAPVPVAPASTPISATSTRSGHSSTPRKTLTDADRRRMCLYHEEHPNTKQTEIGAMFGVERSTVSKVLRNKEKYLYQDDGSRSPIKRSKGKFPDIERALSNWARNHQRQGLSLTDAMIKEKARFFATTVGNNDSHLKVNNTSWLEKFKQKNNLMGAKSRKNSLATEDSEGQSNPASNAQTPNGISPTSPNGASSPSAITLSATKSEEDAKLESTDVFNDYNRSHRPFHSQSNTSLSSVFTDTAPSTFSAGAQSPPSPFFTPDTPCGTSPFIPQGPPGSSNFVRPRSQTFPMVNGIDPSYISPPASSEPLTPKYLNSTAIDSPLSEIPPTVDEPMHNAHSSRSGSMQPPPIPVTSISTSGISVQTHLQHSSPISPESASPASPSQEDARRAIELILNFIQQQPNGFVEPQEYITIGKLMEKLKIQRAGSVDHSQLPGGMHRVHESDFAVRKIENL